MNETLRWSDPAMPWLVLAVVAFFVIRAGTRGSKPKELLTPSDTQSADPAEIEVRLTKISKWVKGFQKACNQRVANHLWLNREFRAKWAKTRPRVAFPTISELKTFSSAAEPSSDDWDQIREVWDEGVGPYCARMNNMLMAAEQKENSKFFETVEKSPLTDEQIQAAICFENRVNVIAAAGSGKTSVMVAKAGYAITRGLVEPGRVLLLAFNRSAAEELRERAQERLSKFGVETEQISISTFHAFGLQMIGEITGKKPSIADWVANGREMEKAREIVKVLLNSDKGFQFEWTMLKTLFRTDLQAFEMEDPPDYWDPSNRKTGMRTLRDEVVKSNEERMIADWLYLNGVDYRYEETYAFDTADAQHGRYTPDFYYPAIDTYHEHFALNSEGIPPAHFTGDYLAGVEWKRSTHRKMGTNLIETTSADLRSKNPFEKLERQLRARGVDLDFSADRAYLGRQPIDDAQILQKLIAFLAHFKSSRLTIERVRASVQKEKSDSHQRHALFVSVFTKFFEGWQASLDEGDWIDFSDMLCQATDLLESNQSAKNFDLILVDEFQDSSVARMALVRALADRPGVQLTAVGDDWQSINRFAGADISIAVNFKNSFGESDEFQLTRTFRCAAAICDVSSAFVMRNAQQQRKKVLGNPNFLGNHLRILIEPSGNTAEEKAQNRLSVVNTALNDLIGAASTQGDSVLILGRYNFELNAISIDANATSQFNVRTSTIHKSKGQEADHVVVVGMDSDSKYGFPSSMDDDPVLGLVMPAADAMPFAEERRLLYVAMTRAKKTVTLIANEKTPSPFVAELVRDFNVPIHRSTTVESELRPCPKCGSFLIRKVNRSTEAIFLGCQTYPRCRYSEPLA